MSSGTMMIPAMIPVPIAGRPTDLKDGLSDAENRNAVAKARAKAADDGSAVDAKAEARVTRPSTKNLNQIGPGKRNHGKMIGPTAGQKAGIPPGMDQTGLSTTDLSLIHI